jgi:hypothetical protein
VTPDGIGSTVLRVTSRGARRQEQRELARSLRAEDTPWPEIAAALRGRYGLGARLAMRMAHDWSQADAAAAWNARWPDDPKSFKNISYWETWPSPTGHAPSLAVLDRLAQIYECAVSDLVAGWGEHGVTRQAAPPTEPEALAWQARELNLLGLTRGPADRLPTPEELAGGWTSRYSYFSTGRDAEYEGEHRIRLRTDGDRLVGLSEPTPTGTLELDLRADGLLVTGSWTERTAPDGYYRGAVYHGVLQMVVDPDGRSMVGRWLGPDKHSTINSGRWTLTRTG